MFIFTKKKFPVVRSHIAEVKWIVGHVEYYMSWIFEEQIPCSLLSRFKLDLYLSDCILWKQTVFSFHWSHRLHIYLESWLNLSIFQFFPRLSAENVDVRIDQPVVSCLNLLMRCLKMLTKSPTLDIDIQNHQGKMQPRLSCRDKSCHSTTFWEGDLLRKLNAVIKWACCF